MASSEVLDFESLLAPIPGENPAGEALREDFSPTSVYHLIKDARAAARANERSVVWGDDESAAVDNRADWKPVLEHAPKTIAERSKDLEVAAWLVEALVRRHGYAGLRDGFRLIRELAERFWDHLYPLPDEEGVSTRLAPITGLNGEDSDGVLITPVFNVPISAEGTYRGLTVSDYQQAASLERLDDPDKRSQRIAQGGASLQMFDKAVSETPPEFFRNLWEDIAECSEQFEGLCAVLEEKCGSGDDGYSLAPPSSNIRSALQTVRDTVYSLAKHLLEEAAAGAGEDEEPGAPGDEQQEGGLRRVRTREEALQALLRVAEFFRRTEPHSPVSYALEQAVRWGRMPLPQLLTELIPEQGTREQLFKLVGIAPPDEPE